MTDLCDRNISCCALETGAPSGPSAPLGSTGSPQRLQTPPEPVTCEETPISRFISGAETSGEDIPLGCETLSRIREGKQWIDRFPLPKLHVKVAKIPLMGSLYFHVDEGTYLETTSPISLRDGRIHDGELGVVGRMGVTFNRDKDMGRYGPFDLIQPPMLGAIESIRFEKGKFWIKFRWLHDVALEAAYEPPMEDGSAAMGLGIWAAVFNYFAEKQLGKRNKDGAYAMTPLLKKKGLADALDGLILERVCEKAKKMMAEKDRSVSALWRDVKAPNLHELKTHGHVTFKNPVMSDPTTGETIAAGTITNLIQSGPDASLDDRRIGIDWVAYENQTEGVGADIEGLEIAVNNDFRLEGTEDVRLSGEIRWNRISFHGPRDADVHIGCIDNSSCCSPEKIRFTLEKSGDQITVEIHITENQIYTDEYRIVGKILPSFLHLLLDLDPPEETAAFAEGRPRLEVAGVVDFFAQSQKQVPITPTVRIAAEAHCQVMPQSNDLLSREIGVEFGCTATSGNVEWLNPQGEIGLRVQVPAGDELIANGEIGVSREGFSIDIGEWASHFEVEAPLIVKAMELIAQTLGKRPTLKSVHVERRNSDGILEATLELYHASVSSNLSSPYFENPMESELDVMKLKATFIPGGFVRLESSDPQRNPFFLSTHAHGSVALLRKGWRFKIDDGQLHISAIEFNYDSQLASFEGRLDLTHINTPQDFLEGDQYQILAPSGAPQRFKIRATTGQWFLTREGVIEIPTADVRLEAIDTAAPAEAEPAAPPLEQKFLDVAIPPLEQVADEPESPAFGSLVGPVMALFTSVGRIEKARITVPQTPGSMTLFKLDGVLSATLEVPEGEKRFWTVSARTGTDWKERGDEVITHFVLAPDKPVRLCINVFGYCISQEESRLRAIELITSDPDIRDEEPLVFSSGHEIPRHAKRKGAILLRWETGPDLNIVKNALKKLGIDSDQAEAMGIRIRQNEWYLPVELEKIQEVLLAIAPEMTRKMEELEKEEEKRKKKKKGDGEGPQFQLGRMTGEVDLRLRSGLREIHIPPHGNEESDRLKPHPHLFIETLLGSRLAAQRETPDSPLEIDSLYFPFLGMTFDNLERGEIERIRLDPDISHLQTPFFAFLRGFRLIEPSFDLKNGRVTGRVEVGEASFQLGKREGHYRWDGTVTNYRSGEVTVYRETRDDPFDNKAEEVPVTIACTDSLRYTFDLRKGPLSESGPTVAPVHFRGAPTFTDACMLVYPDRIEARYKTAADTVTFEGPHFKAEGLRYSAQEVMMTAQLTDEIAQGNVWVRIPERLTLHEGAFELGAGRVEIGGESYVEDATLIVADETANLSSRKISINLRGFKSDFIKRLGLPPGFELKELELDSIQMEGPLFAGSTVTKRDIDLRGELRMRATGRLRFSYRDKGFDVRDFDSPVEVDFGRVTRLQTAAGKLSLLEFEDGVIRLRDIDTRLALFGSLKTHLEAFGLSGRTTNASVRIGKGAIKLGSGAGSDGEASVKLSDLSIDLTAHSHDTSVGFREGDGEALRIHWPQLTSEVSLTGATIDAVQKNGRWKTRLILGPTSAHTNLQQTRLKR